MSDLTMKYTCSVNYLLSRNAVYSGWLKKITDGAFGKSSKRRYGVIHEAMFYLFNDDQSLATNDVIPLGEFTVEETERIGAAAKWGFSLHGQRSGGKGREVVQFTVGSERELKDWIYMLESWKLVPYDDGGSENAYSTTTEDVPTRKSSNNIDFGKLSVSDARYTQDNTSRSPMPLPGSHSSSGKQLVYEVSGERAGPSHVTPSSMQEAMLLSPDDEGYYADPDQGPRYDNTNDYLPSSVFKWTLDRNQANDLLSNFGTPGVYIIRKGKDKGDVISAFLLNESRHYKIFVEKDELFLRNDHPHFRKHIDLIMYYHLNNLPTCHARLESPYR